MKILRKDLKPSDQMKFILAENKFGLEIVLTKYEQQLNIIYFILLNTPS